MKSTYLLIRLRTVVREELLEAGENAVLAQLQTEGNRGDLRGGRALLYYRDNRPGQKMIWLVIS